MSNNRIKRFYRSREDKVVGGLFGGLGEYLKVDSSILRLIFLFVLILTAFLPGILAYFIALLVIPVESKNHNS